MSPEPISALLRQLLHDTPNAALNALLADYVTYHATLAWLGGALSVAALLGAAASWRRAGRMPRHTRQRAGWGMLGTLLALLGTPLALLALVNADTARHPRDGFSLLLGDVALAGQPGPRQQAFTAWLRAGQAAPSRDVQERVQRRLAWQRPKAIWSGVLALLCAGLTARCWQPLLRRPGRPTGVCVAFPARRINAWRHLLTGGLSAGAALLLLVMFLANTQAARAPLTLTLLYGS